MPRLAPPSCELSALRGRRLDLAREFSTGRAIHIGELTILLIALVFYAVLLCAVDFQP